MTLSATDRADDRSLAARFVTTPQLFSSDDARGRLAGWLGDLPAEQRAAFEGVCTRSSRARAILEGIAEASVYLFDLIRADPERTLRLLEADPDERITRLVADLCVDVAAAPDEATAMQVLRRMKAEAALLIALCDIGGVWPVMRVTAALTDVAVTATRCSVRWLLAQETARGRIVPADPEDPEFVAAMTATIEDNRELLRRLAQ